MQEIFNTQKKYVITNFKYIVITINIYDLLAIILRWRSQYEFFACNMLFYILGEQKLCIF